ncbi:MAG: hypothetical protein AB2814_09880, partial [Candidatus Sedimenticola endophacoides]
MVSKTGNGAAGAGGGNQDIEPMTEIAPDLLGGLPVRAGVIGAEAWPFLSRWCVFPHRSPRDEGCLGVALAALVADGAHDVGLTGIFVDSVAHGF